MRKYMAIGLFALFAIGIYSFTAPLDTPQTDELKWYTWEEAVEANKTVQKKFMVDVYTDWCGWCKRMDKTTFNDPVVRAYLEEHFYPVKLDAEQKDDISFNGHTFNWVQGGRNGVHTLAYSLLDGRMSYPSVVYLTENFERIMVSPGYKNPDKMMEELKFAAEEQYIKENNKTTKGTSQQAKNGKE